MRRPRLRALVIAGLVGCAEQAEQTEEPGHPAPPVAIRSHPMPGASHSSGELPAPVDTPRHEAAPVSPRIPLWPMTAGLVEIPVCWATPLVDPKRYPNEAWSRSVVPLAEKQGWVREIAEAQFGARTPIRFVGWGSCDTVDASKFVQIVPIDSMQTACSKDGGRSCVDALGAASEGGHMYLNLALGDEFLYDAHYTVALARGEADEADAIATNPSGTTNWYCQGLWDAVDYSSLDEPSAVARVHEAFKACVQFTALHELGHLAGFGHEQARTDFPAERDRCLTAIGYDPEDAEQFRQSAPDERVNWPTRPFDSESVMSSCRASADPILTDLDVARAKLTYSSNPETTPRDGAFGSGALRRGESHHPVL